MVDARVFTDYDPELLESAEPGQTDFRVSLKLENTGKTPVDLGELSTIIEGATNGGEASFTTFERGSQVLPTDVGVFRRPLELKTPAGLRRRTRSHTSLTDCADVSGP
ncbi:hypothetical protein AB0O86_29140 [Streptomyces hirsutus]|uniref:hypothetical protein n=1 Tax=Streptomyces hirsutus TaxID=35620 RepID=UPI00344998D6